MSGGRFGGPQPLPSDGRPKLLRVPIGDDLWAALTSWCRHIDASAAPELASPRKQRRDPCVVLTAPLADLLVVFVASWNATRPSTGGQFAPGETRTEVVPLSALRWLAQETGISEDTISNVVRRRHRHTELRIADALVTALDRPEAFWDGTLHPLENPQAPADAIAQVRRDGGCDCGGSGED